MKYWLSWYDKNKYSEFELHSPWWISGSDDGAQIICAAVKAENEEAAMELIYAAYDKRPKNIYFRFILQQLDNWIPFCGRFPKERWMKWN